MKKFIIALFLAVLAASTASAAYNLTFTLSNESGYNFTEIWLKPSVNIEWNAEYDKLTVKGSSRASTLDNGNKTKITFDNVSSTRKNVAIWDLSVKLSNGEYKTWEKMDLSDIVMIRIDRGFMAHKTTAADILDLF